MVEWLATNTTTIYPTLESQELYSDPSEEDISDAQPFRNQEEEVATAVTQQSDDSTQISTGRLVPAVAAYSEISIVSDGEGDVDDDMSTDITWVPTREEEEGSSEGEMDQQIGRRSRPNLHCTGGTNLMYQERAINHVRSHLALPGYRPMAPQCGLSLTCPLQTIVLPSVAFAVNA